jgi:hypothetical protein
MDHTFDASRGKKDLTQHASLLQELAITSDEALSLEELPKRAVILGGGYDISLCILVATNLLVYSCDGMLQIHCC